MQIMENFNMMKTESDERMASEKARKRMEDFNFCVQLNSFDQRCNKTKEMVNALSRRLNDMKQDCSNTSASQET